MTWDDEYSVRLSRTMRTTLSALLDGRTLNPGDRPPMTTIKTLLALERRGLIEYRGKRWHITAAGKQHAE